MENIAFYLNQLLTKTAGKNASSLHLAVGGLPTLRVDDHFEVIESDSIIDLATIEKIIDAYLDQEEKSRLEEKRSLMTVKDFSNFRFKVSVFYQKKMPSLSFYHIHPEIRTLEELKFPASLKKFLELSSGLLVVSGPHLSGKSNTAAAFIEEINRNNNKRVITLEDPIERQFISKKCIIEQRQVGVDVVSYEDGLYYAMKEDVDLVYISDNHELMQKGLSAVMELASGNALVIMEMNAQSTVNVLDKLLSILEKDYSREAAGHLLADVLYAVIVQRLIPKRGGGLALACEIAVNNSSMKTLIRENKSYQVESIIETSKKEGMVNMSRSLFDLVQNGEVRQEDVL